MARNSRNSTLQSPHLCKTGSTPPAVTVVENYENFMKSNGLILLTKVALVVLAVDIALNVGFYEIHHALPGLWGALLPGTVLVAVILAAVYLLVIRPNSLEQEREIAELRETTSKAESHRIKEAEESEEALFSIIHESPVAIGITDEEGRPVYWNPRFRKLGKRRDEIDEHNEFQLTFSNPSLSDELQRRMRAGETIRDEEMELIDAKGERAWAEISIQEMVFEGRKSSLTWVYDITERKKQEHEQKMARMAAEESNRTKSLFLATMSHEIRTPLNGIATMAEILETTGLSCEQGEMTSIISDSSATLLAIINDILDYSKIESGKLELELRSLSLTQTVEGVLDLMGGQAAEKNIDLISYIEPESPDHVLGDAVRLRQILTNLVANAVKFTEGGQVSIEVSTEATEGADPLVVFNVIDTGIGIDKENMRKLFKPFTQADNSIARRYGGSGLGLSICSAILQAMSGYIGAESEKGKGSHFWFKVPLTVLPERRTSRAGQLAGKRVLVVTDNTFLSRHLDRYVTFTGATIEPLSSVEEVPARLNDGTMSDADVLLFDTDMGRGAIENFAASITEEFAQRTKIVTLVNRARASTNKPELFNTFFAGLPKPLKRGQFFDVLAAAAGLEELDSSNETNRHEDLRQPLGTYNAPDAQTALDEGALILVAEDNPVNQNVIAILLAGLGYAVEITGDGAEAFAKYQETDYGLLITDCHMPELDGYELTHKIRQFEKRSGRKHLPIIALTADALIGTGDKCLEAGMDGYLKKPAGRAELDAAIGEFLPAGKNLRTLRTAETKPAGRTPQGETGDPTKAHTNPGRRKTDNPAGDDKPVFDTAYLNEVTGGDTEMINMLLQNYMETTPALVTETITALESHEFDTARKSAHAIKGASMMAGALRLAELCQAIQGSIENAEFQTAVSCKAEVQDNFDAYAEEVKLYMHSLAEVA